MVEQKRNSNVLKQLPVFDLVLGGVLITTIILYGLGNRSEIKDIIKLCIFAGVVTILLSLYFSILGHHVKKMPYFNTIFITDFFLVILLIMLSVHKVPYSVMLMGGLITAVFFDAYFGIFYTNITILFAGITGVINAEYLIYLIIIGTLLCLLAPYMKNIKTFVLVLIIVFSIQIMLLIVSNHFYLEEDLYIKLVHEILVSLFIIVISMLLFILYQFKLDKDYELGINVTKIDSHSLTEIVSEDFPLLKKLKETLPKTYDHALVVSKISAQAAKAVGLDELLAKAGGLYHEIGKLGENDYRIDGVNYALEYGLPSSVIAIINSYNLKYAKPISPEGAIVNLTISVLSAKEYLKRNLAKDKVRTGLDLDGLMHKGVEEIFQLRFVKGSLDESGLTIKQFHELKEFFLKL